MSDHEDATLDDNTEPFYTPEAKVVGNSESTIIPNYMTEDTSKKGVTLEEDVFEEEGEIGCGGDSDIDAEDGDDIFTGRQRPTTLKEPADDTNEVALDNDHQFVFVGKGAIKDNTGSIMKIASVPEDFKPPPVNKQRKEKPFSKVDNPGDWHPFCYIPRYKKVNNKWMYWRHTLPTGVMPHPADKKGKRGVNGWSFYYKGWTGSNTPGLSRVHATPENLFPKARLGELDVNMLKRLGLTKKRVVELDALFFFQLLLPICDVNRSGVDDDKRMPFYSKMEEWSNIYAMQLGLGGTYGHKYKNVTSKELLHFDGCVVRDGVRGGSGGALYRRWMTGTDYDDKMSAALSYRRFIQIKRVKKLCNNKTAPKKGEEDYNPTYKYDYIFQTIVHNTNLLLKSGELDITGDETSWATASFGEAGAGVTFRVQGKPGVTKGGQTVIISDSHRIRPRAYMHRHKLHVKPDGWTAMGPIEAKTMLDTVKTMVHGEEGDAKKLYMQKPHFTWDNYFSGDQIMDYAGEQGFGMTMTCRRDRLPKDVDGSYFHKDRTDATAKSRVARFHQPVVAVKLVKAANGNNMYRRVHVSFQSTSSCNISTVNALSSCKLQVEKRERGVSANKRTWGIEMNSSRSLYLRTYSRIDSIDHLIKNCKLSYRSWKYWHAPVLHATGLAIVTAYDIYLEACEGNLEKDWKLVPVDFWTFREKLSSQMLEYDPVGRRYPGDDEMRACTQQSKDARRLTFEEEEENEKPSPATRKRGRPKKADDKQLDREKEFKRAKTGRGENSRLCGDLSRLKKHIKSAKHSIKHPKKCKVCGGDAYSMCGICGVFLHYSPMKGKYAGKNCFHDYHDDGFFGLARDDDGISNVKKSEWKYPTVAKEKSNSQLNLKYCQVAEM